MADEHRKEMEQWAREDAQRIDQPGSAPGVAVPGQEVQKGRLVDDAKAAFGSGQGQQQSRQSVLEQQGMSAPRQTSAPRPMGAGHTGTEMKQHAGGGMSSMTTTMAGTAQAETVTVKGACAVAQANEAYITGAAGAVVSAGDTKFTGGTLAVVSGGETKVTAGGAPIIISGDEIEIEKGGAAVMIAKEIEVEEQGFVGIALGGKVEVEDGGKVLISTVPAILLGAALGATFALVTSLMGGRKESAEQQGMMTRGRKTSEDEDQNFLAKMAAGMGTAGLMSRFAGGEEGMKEKARGGSEQLITRAARADAQRRARKAWKEARKATAEARKAAKEAMTGRV